MLSTFNNTPASLVVLVVGVCAILPLFVAADDVTLTILHTNDVHSRFMQTNKYSGSCSEKDEKNNTCYGGFARLHYKVIDHIYFNH